MLPVPLALLAFACHDDRAEELERRVAERRAEVEALRTQAAELAAVLRETRPRSASVREDLDPVGYDPDAPLPAGDPARPDVLLVSIDTLRADHLGTYGYARDTSPFLDRLAARGTVFEDAWSPSPWTLPSHTTMLTGLVPAHHGVIEDDLRIGDDLPLLQEAFRDAGWGTIGVVSTLFVSSRYGFDRGFDAFHDFGILDKETNNLGKVDADQVFHHALDLARQQPDGRPLFLFTHVYDCHFGYDAPEPWNTRFDRAPRWDDEVYKNYEVYRRRMIPKVQLDHQIAQYDEEIAWVDAMLEELVETWRASGRELVVVVTADHGEELGERGSWGHGHTVYPEQLHVPLIVAGPGIPAARLHDRIGTEDLAPTIASLAGVPFAPADGRSRADQILHGTPPGTVSARYAETSRQDTLAVRWHDPPYDLVVDFGEGRRQLFDVDADPLELHDLYGPQRARADAMFGDLASFLGEPWTARASGVVSVTDGVLLAGGRRVGDVLPVNRGDRFAAWPGDATVRFGESAWAPLGGEVPDAADPLSYEGRVGPAVEEERTLEDCEMLVALGYFDDIEDCLGSR
ncbi:MAG: sulfatase-like hydrolase/transferase [Alphaproteobacteria bacterium]|nr:sulfatase-like hydrolase/transferase [Alphaproteobacteria bacterium]MCB9699400.1 sulfatase-like hydrolase/transferase [Alphaproteobacteria bacterium]